MQWHRICITILKGRRGGRGRKNGPKEARNPEWQTLNPVTLMFYVKGLGWLCAFSFWCLQHTSPLRLVSLHARSSPGHAALLGTHLTALTPLTSEG